jgi:DNA-directed RNA polymerase specialized sigma24 family protein
VSLTGALRAGDPVVFGRLYDEHAVGLYTYCRAMVGEEAADALRVTFAAGTRPPGPPPGESGNRIWLYGLARAECRRRGALLRSSGTAPVTSPMGLAVMRLRPEHREALVLAAALRTDELAKVLGVAADTAEMLLDMARRRLANAAATALSTGAEPDQAMMLALDEGRVHELLTFTTEPPAALRDQVLVACSVAGRAVSGALLFDETGMPITLDTVFGPAETRSRTAENDGPEHRPRGTHGRRRVGPILGLAAGVAVAAGALVLWPATGGDRTSNVDQKNRIGGSSAPGSSSLGDTSPLRTVPRPSVPSVTGTPPASPTPARPPTSSSSPPSASVRTPSRPTQASSLPGSPHPHPGKSHGAKGR